MTNEIPYVDYSSGEPVERYFGPPPLENANLEAMRRSKSKVKKKNISLTSLVFVAQHNTERRYLSREITEKFNAHEIVCGKAADMCYKSCLLTLSCSMICS
jgi:hypothetical protein